MVFKKNENFELDYFIHKNIITYTNKIYCIKNNRSLESPEIKK